MANLDLKTAITAINDRLKAASIPARARLNGKYLVLRATLPKKPADGTGTKQYDLSLGIPANKDGLRRIEIEAQTLGKHLALNTFSWDKYLKPKDDPQEKTVSQWVEAFRADYMRLNRIKEKTWRETWQRTLDRLPQDEPLTEALILAVVLQTEPHSRIRELTCQRLQKLATFSGIQIDLKPHQGDYNERSTEPRDIPTDEAIVECRDKIPNPAWQWVYGMLATFGLRPHEVFFCELVDLHTLKILEGKRGFRITRAIQPEWSEQWNLLEVKRPKVSGKTYRDYGQRVSHQFSRYELPFVPYDLRHAWAIRASVVKGLPISTAAAMMGHSVEVHTRIYHHWLHDSVNEQIYRKIVLGTEP